MTEGLQALEEKLDDREAFLVYADHLSARGDPRGELIMVQDTLARAPTSELRRRQADLLSNPRLGLSAELDHWVRATWRRGFLDTVTVDLEEKPSPRGAGLVRTVLEHPSARLLRGLTVGFRRGSVRYRKVVDALEASPARATLRSLTLGTVNAHPARVGLGPVEPLRRLFPRLETLALRGKSVRGSSMAGLRALTLELDLWDRTAIEMAASPDLVALTFNASYLPWGRWLLAHCPPLQRLGWRGPAVDHSCIAALVQSELARGLVELDLSGSAITDADAELLRDSRARLSALRVVDVRGTRMTVRGRAWLLGLAEKVVE